MSKNEVENNDMKTLLTASLDESQAKAVYAMGEEAVVFALLTLTVELAKAKGNRHKVGRVRRRRREACRYI